MFNPTHTTNQDGEDVTVIRLYSSLLPHLNVDTYTCFNGDSWTEIELEGMPDDYDSYEWDYDHAGIIEGLAEANIEAVLDQLGTDGIIESVEFIASSSPREYNFATDSFEATWTLNTAKLQDYWNASGWTFESYVAKYHSSYSGFISFVDTWLEEEPEDTKPWLMLACYLRFELDEEQLFMSVAEAEHEIYSENVTVTPVETETAE